MMNKSPLITIGWREWVTLPELNIRVKAKVDTGAKTSCLHAYNIKLIDSETLSFKVHPLQKTSTPTIQCQTKFIERRTIRSSNGLTQTRYVIQTPILIAGIKKTIHITLTNRSEMGFRMLLGRSALHGFLIQPTKSFLSSTNPI